MCAKLWTVVISMKILESHVGNKNDFVHFGISFIWFVLNGTIIKRFGPFG